MSRWQHFFFLQMLWGNSYNFQQMSSNMLLQLVIPHCFMSRRRMKTVTKWMSQEVCSCLVLSFVLCSLIWALVAMCALF